MKMKRVIDIIASALGLIVLSPVIFLFALAIFASDFHSPFYIAQRIGKNGKPFNMIKLRSMIINADLSGVDSTSNTDNRITQIGATVRKYKIDEITQLINVLFGSMSLVGPRPNIERETNLYSEIEKKLLLTKPGITDFASIVFADEGDILSGEKNPDIAYHQLIRPWKSKLGLLYVEKHSITLDFMLIFATIMGLFSRNIALKMVRKALVGVQADESLINISRRNQPLIPTIPPGLNAIVRERKLRGHD